MPTDLTCQVRVGGYGGAEGLAQFEVYAAEHEAEVNRIFDGLTEAELDQLSDLLKRMRGKT